VHSVDDPSPTICAQGRVNLVTGHLSGSPAHPRPYDILYRMFEPHELAAAMSISTPEAPYRFAGNKTEVVRQIGQAVPRRTGRALALALMGGER
jgi:DNA (cytosine-5)-methyltransferase 1